MYYRNGIILLIILFSLENSILIASFNDEPLVVLNHNDNQYVSTDLGNSYNLHKSIPQVRLKTETGLFISENLGKNWNRIGTKINTIFLNSDNARYKSVDGGNRWIKLTEDLIEYDNLISVYPVPAKDVLTIELGNTCEYCSLEIYSAAGKLLNTLKFHNTNRFDINVSHFSNGKYHLRVITENNIYNKILIIVK